MQLIGRSANQVPVNGMLGRLAYLDDLPPELCARALLQRQEISSAVASVAFVANIDGRFPEFLIRWRGLTVASADVLAIQTSSDYGATWDSGASNYYYALNRMASTGGSSDNGSAGTYGLVNGIQNVSTTASHGGSNGRLRLINPADTTMHKTILTECGENNSATLKMTATGAIWRASTAAINGVKIFAVGGANLTAGVLELLGEN
jgi:hypothetical protein